MTEKKTCKKSMVPSEGRFEFHGTRLWDSIAKCYWVKEYSN
jgi:hypothetical protein